MYVRGRGEDHYIEVGGGTWVYLHKAEDIAKNLTKVFKVAVKAAEFLRKELEKFEWAKEILAPWLISETIGKEE